MTFLLEFMVLLAVFVCCYGAEDICLGIPDGTKVEIHCWGYYYCNKNQSVPFHCGPGQVFDRNSMVCVLSSAVGNSCGPIPVHCYGKPDGNHPDYPVVYNRGCETFYTCRSETFVGRQYCPADLVFDPISKACSSRSEVLKPCGDKEQ